MARFLAASLVGGLALIAFLPACSPAGSSASPLALATATTPPLGMPATWRKVAENTGLPGGYRLDWRYEAPEGSRTGTAQQISLGSMDMASKPLITTATALLAVLHHNVGFGAAAIVDRNGKQAGFNYFGDDTGTLPPSPTSATSPIMGTIWFRQQDGRTEALDVFGQTSSPGDATPKALSSQWLP